MEVRHLTIASRGRLPLLRDEAARRRAVRLLPRTTAGRLVFFALVDDHAHVVLAGEPPELAAATGALVRAWRAAGFPADRPHVRPVERRAHLAWLLQEYLPIQTRRHGLDAHPALWTGSAFQDLVRARAVPGLSLRLGELLPRFPVRDALRAVGLPPHPVPPLPDERVRELGVHRLVSAAATAAALGPGLRGRPREVVEVRRAVAAIGRAVGLPAGALAAGLGTSLRHVPRLAAAPHPTALVEAIRRRLALEEHVARHAPVAAEPMPLHESNPVRYRAEE